MRRCHRLGLCDQIMVHYRSWSTNSFRALSSDCDLYNPLVWNELSIPPDTLQLVDVRLNMDPIWRLYLQALISQVMRQDDRTYSIRNIYLCWNVCLTCPSVLRFVRSSGSKRVGLGGSINTGSKWFKNIQTGKDNLPDNNRPISATLILFKLAVHHIW